ncbi:MAG: MG(2+) CHELATASE FAMILY PROTEIN / ComM-related protein, partial [uncultured Thermomicrobiales bacterium]
ERPARVRQDAPGAGAPLDPAADDDARGLGGDEGLQRPGAAPAGDPTAPGAAVPRPPPHDFERRTGRRRVVATARRDQPGAPGRAVPRRVARVRRGDPGDAAPAARGPARHPRPGIRDGHLPGQLHAGRRDEPLPLRAPWRPRSGVPVLRLGGGPVPEEDQRAAARPGRHPPRGAAGRVREAGGGPRRGGLGGGPGAGRGREGAPGGALRGVGPCHQRRHGPARAWRVRRPRRDRRGAAEGGGAPTQPLGAGLPPGAQAGPDDRRPRRRADDRHPPPGRGDPVPTPASGRL